MPRVIERFPERIVAHLRPSQFGNFLILIHSAAVFQKSCQAPKIAKFLLTCSFDSGNRFPKRV